MGVSSFWEEGVGKGEEGQGLKWGRGWRGKGGGLPTTLSTSSPREVKDGSENENGPQEGAAGVKLDGGYALADSCKADSFCTSVIRTSS